MDQDQEQLDPAEVSAWAAILKKSKGQGAGLDLGNAAAVAAQQAPGVDQSTEAQAQGAQLPPASRKAAAQAAIQQRQSAPGILESMNAEQGQIDAMKKQLGEYLKKPREIDFSPIAALTDSWTGSDFAKHYKAPQSDEQRAETMAKLQNIISQRNGDLTKQKIALMVAQNRGDTSLMGSDKPSAGDIMMQTKQKQWDNSAHQRVLHAVKKDPTYTGMFQQARRLASALDFVDKAKVTTPQQLDEMQQTVRRQLGITGTSGVDERSKTMLDSMGLKAARAEQYLFSHPVDVKESQQEFIQHLRDLVAVAQENTKTQADSQLAKLTAGNPDLYERRPDLKRGLEELLSASKNQFAPASLYAAPPKSAPKAQGGSPDESAARQARIAELRKKLGK